MRASPIRLGKNALPRLSRADEPRRHRTRGGARPDPSLRGRVGRPEMTGAPQFSPPTLPDRVRQALAEFDPATVARAESFLATSARPCVDFNSERVSAAPLRRGLFGRLLGRPIVAPQLP